jgi:hypothetical protein
MLKLLLLLFLPATTHTLSASVVPQLNPSVTWSLRMDFAPSALRTEQGRLSPITSRKFDVRFEPLDGYEPPQGKISGEGITGSYLLSEVRTCYNSHFNLHHSHPHLPTPGPRRQKGWIVGVGPLQRPLIPILPCQARHRSTPSPWFRRRLPPPIHLLLEGPPLDGKKRGENSGGQIEPFPSLREGSRVIQCGPGGTRQGGDSGGEGNWKDHVFPAEIYRSVVKSKHRS